MCSNTGVRSGLVVTLLPTISVKIIYWASRGKAKYSGKQMQLVNKAELSFMFIKQKYGF